MKILRLLPALLLLAAVACGGSDGGGTEPPPDDRGEFRIEAITVGGADRSYLVWLPPGLPAANRRLMVALHGQGSVARQMVERTGLDLLADSLDMVLALPDAVQGSWSDEDTTFIRLVVDSLAVRHQTDPGGAYVLGFSQGGHMAMLVACRYATRVRSMMIHAVSMSRELAEGCDPASSVPAFFLLGTQDVLAPWEPTAGALGGEGTAEWWADADGCEAEPSRQETAGTIQLDWTQCQGGARVRMIGVVGGGHLFFPYPDYDTLGDLVDWLGPF